MEGSEVSVGRPWVYVTVVPDPAAAWIPASGVTVPDGITYALPPPAYVGDTDADGPITAIVPAPEDDSGSTGPAFFSSVVPSSATEVATATSAGVVTVAEADPVRGWLNRLYWNISVKIRWTMVFSALCGMVPFRMAVCRAVP